MPRKSDLPRGIDRRPNGMYRARVTWNHRQYSIGNFFTLGDAKAALAIARSEIARQVFIPPTERQRAIQSAELRERVEALTVAQWADDWLERLADLDKSPGTTRSYRSTLDKWILPTLGEHRLVDVTRDDVDDLMDQVRAKRGPWANVARTIRALFRAALAAEVGGLTVSPVHVTIPKSKRADDHVDTEEVATPAEVRALTEAMPEHLRIAVPLAAWCALRQGELLGLQRRDLEHLDDPQRAVLHVRRQWHSKTSPPAYAPPKAGSRRSMAIPALILDELRAHIDTYAGPGREGPVLPSPRNPKVPMSQSALDRYWHQARDAVLPGFKFHNLRHTGLTEFARAGATLDELRRRGGHADVAAAMKYQHATAERDRALTERLNQVVSDG